MTGVLGFPHGRLMKHVCVVGFSKGRLVLHKSEIDVTSLLEFVDLGHSTEPR